MKNEMNFMEKKIWLPREDQASFLDQTSILAYLSTPPPPLSVPLSSSFCDITWFFFWFFFHYKISLLAWSVNHCRCHRNLKDPARWTFQLAMTAIGIEQLVVLEFDRCNGTAPVKLQDAIPAMRTILQQKSTQWYRKPTGATATNPSTCQWNFLSTAK